MTGLQISSNCNLNKCSLQLQELANILTRLPNLVKRLRRSYEAMECQCRRDTSPIEQPIARLGFADGRDW